MLTYLIQARKSRVDPVLVDRYEKSRPMIEGIKKHVFPLTDSYFYDCIFAG